MKEIIITFGFATQIQETMYITYASFVNCPGLVIKDAINNQHCEFARVNDTSIKINNLTDNRWTLTVYGR
jgi:hypothetical protein